ncbi:MAG: hypothetical protein NVS3B2_10670 [Ramlibacter sp.]
MVKGRAHKVAVIGAGIAGAACARALSQGGATVQIFDKSRGPGGRLATRRVEWLDPHGQLRETPFDHGVVSITAHSPAFQSFVAQAVQGGSLAQWRPVLAPVSAALDGGSPHYVPVPDLPALSRSLLEGVAATWSSIVEALHKGPPGWEVQARGQQVGGHFDAVVLALPPAQAAPLLKPHRRDWSLMASVELMKPCWTLMGVADATEGWRGWDLARPAKGVLAWVVRNDARPGRARVPGQAHWVLHASAAWSRRHFEQPAAWVRSQMQGALADWLGHPVNWRHGVVHRWRYAAPQVSSAAPAGTCWWDASMGLGVCGDFLGNGGVEGAWLSAQSLAAALLHSIQAEPAPDSPHRTVESPRPNPVLPCAT